MLWAPSLPCFHGRVCETPLEEALKTAGKLFVCDRSCSQSCSWLSRQRRGHALSKDTRPLALEFDLAVRADEPGKVRVLFAARRTGSRASDGGLVCAALMRATLRSSRLVLPLRGARDLLCSCQPHFGPWSVGTDKSKGKAATVSLAASAASAVGAVCHCEGEVVPAPDRSGTEPQGSRPGSLGRPAQPIHRTHIPLPRGCQCWEQEGRAQMRKDLF